MLIFKGWMHSLSDKQLENYIKMGPSHSWWNDDTDMIQYLKALCELEKRTSKEYINLLLRELKINVPYSNIAKLVKSYIMLEICILCVGILCLMLLQIKILIPLYIFFALLLIWAAINELYLRKFIKAIKTDMEI